MGDKPVEGKLAGRNHSTRARKPSKKSLLPSCTHIDMDRVHGGDKVCDLCGNVADMNFLYECRQDYKVTTLRQQLQLEQREKRDSVHGPKSRVRMQLEEAGMQEGIIVAAEEGHYTQEQLNHILSNKAKVNYLATTTPTPHKSPITEAALKLAALTNTTEEFKSDAASNIKKDAVSPSRSSFRPHRMLARYRENEERLRAKQQAALRCTFRACHTCRPYSRDRMYISIEHVLAGEFEPVTLSDSKRLAVENVQVLRTIGLTVPQISLPTSAETCANTLLTPLTRLSPATSIACHASSSSRSSRSTSIHTSQTDLSPSSSWRSFTKGFGRKSYTLEQYMFRRPRQSLKAAVQGIFTPSAKTWSDAASNITLPIARTGIARESAEAQEFDMAALRRVARGLAWRGSDVAGDQRIDTAQKGHENKAKAARPCHPPCAVLPEGAKVRVVGGVALTEEAVETKTPDVLAVSPAQTVHFDTPRRRDTVAQVEEDKDLGAGLESVMAQV